MVTRWAGGGKLEFALAWGCVSMGVGFLIRPNSHGVQMALLQHSSLYASRASALQRAQKKALGKTVVGRELDT
jgi:hypothetical protein